MNESENMHRIRSTAVPRMLCQYTVYSIGSCCRFCVDWIISYCLRIDMKLFQTIHKFPFLTNYKLSVKGSIGPNESTVSCTCFANVEFESRHFRGEEVNKNNGESYKFNRSGIYQLTCPLLENFYRKLKFH
jgi:hypothetical protein